MKQFAGKNITKTSFLDDSFRLILLCYEVCKAVVSNFENDINSGVSFLLIISSLHFLGLQSNKILIISNWWQSCFCSVFLLNWIPICSINMWHFWPYVLKKSFCFMLDYDYVQKIKSVCSKRERLIKLFSSWFLLKFSPG